MHGISHTKIVFCIVLISGYRGSNRVILLRLFHKLVQRLYIVDRQMFKDDHECVYFA
jgi:hypothetical protein